MGRRALLLVSSPALVSRRNRTDPRCSGPRILTWLRGRAIEAGRGVAALLVLPFHASAFAAVPSTPTTKRGGVFDFRVRRGALLASRTAVRHLHLDAARRRGRDKCGSHSPERPVWSRPLHQATNLVIMATLERRGRRETPIAPLHPQMHPRLRSATSSRAGHMATSTIAGLVLQDSFEHPRPAGAQGVARLRWPQASWLGLIVVRCEGAR